jgi:hypothetical protein
MFRELVTIKVVGRIASSGSLIFRSRVAIARCWIKIFQDLSRLAMKLMHGIYVHKKVRPTSKLDMGNHDEGQDDSAGAFHTHRVNISWENDSIQNRSQGHVG